MTTKAQYNKYRRHSLREEINSIKEAQGCIDCKIKYPYYVLDFDHLDANTKINNTNALVRLSTRKKVLEEIAKCEVVCANCHRIRSHSRLKNKMVSSSNGRISGSLLENEEFKSPRDH